MRIVHRRQSSVVHIIHDLLAFLLLPFPHPTVDHWRIEYFAGIHEPVRIQGLFDAFHDTESLRSDFLEEFVFFEKADGMLALDF